MFEIFDEMCYNSRLIIISIEVMMARRTRLGLIRKLESLRGSRIIAYFTGDREGLQTKIATDVFPFILEHLESMGKTSKIDLFLYTSGGIAIAGTGLVALLREYCDKLSVIIPFKAHSAGTLIALGADSIVMSRVAQLSPVDPSVQSPYNPQAPGAQPMGPVNLLPVSVEEVIGYLNLAREEAKIKDDNAMASVFKELSSKVHPLALGNVFRARAQIRLLATQLLTRHMGEGRQAQVEKIVSKLTQELYSHDYIVGRKEAKEILGLNIEDVDEDTDKTIWNLYKEYEKLLELTVPLTPALLLGEKDEARFTFNRGIIESRLRVDAYQSDQSFRRIQLTPPGAPAPVIGYQGNVFSQYWVRGARI
jgi:ClpP class serine protease